MSNWRLTLFGDDDATPLLGSVAGGVVAEATCSTDPAHPRPFLMVPESLGESEVDLAEGSSVIGQVNVRILDRRRVQSDQSTGWFTQLLGVRSGAATGEGALNGRRALLEQQDRSGAWFTLMDGVMGGVRLEETLVTYALEIRDARERERKIRAFLRADTATILPRGVLNGYGRRQSAAGFLPGSQWLVRPTVPLTGRYKRVNDTQGYVDLARYWHDFWPPRRVTAALVVSPKLEEVLKPETRIAQSYDFFGTQLHAYENTYARVRILWRRPGTVAWTEIRAPVARQWGGRGLIDTHNARIEGVEDSPVVKAAHRIVMGSPNAAKLPPHNTDVEVIVAYNGPPSEEFPLHLEGMTAGQLLKKLYDGDYSAPEDNPGKRLRIRYDQTALLRLSTPVRGRITEEVEDLREWVQENIYKPLGAAPALDARGRISPVRYALPAQNVTLPELNDGNTAADATWEHPASDAVNHVVARYVRDYRVRVEDDPAGERSTGDGLAQMEVTIEREHAPSVAAVGDRKLEVDLILFRGIGGTEGDPISGDVTDEVGHSLAMERAEQALDRFVYGAQTVRARCRRSDPAVAALKVGDWVMVSLSWLPDYATGERGGNRLAQVMAVRDLDPAWRELRLVDAGAEHQPLTLPFGPTATIADGRVTVSAVPTLGDWVVRADYAVADTRPNESSADWIMLGRSPWGQVIPDRVSFTTPVLPPGSTVWTRVRTEAMGRRPSAWRLLAALTLPQTPGIRDLRVLLDDQGVPTVFWTPSPMARGVRIRWGVHLPELEPALDGVVLAAAGPGQVVLPVEVAAGQAVTVEVEPWETWSGTAVSGLSGPMVRASAARVTDESTFSLLNFRETERSDTHVAFQWARGVRVAQVWVYDVVHPQPVPSDPWPGADAFPSATLVPGQDEYRVALPPAGHVRYVQFEPRTETHVAGPLRRVTLLPAALDPVLERIEQTRGSDSLRTSVSLDIRDPRRLGGTLRVWTARDSPDSADPSGPPEGTYEVPFTPASASASTAFLLPGGGSAPLLSNVRVHPARGKRIFLEFVNAEGLTTGVRDVSLHGWTDLIGDDDKLRDQAIERASQFASTLTPVEVVDVLPATGRPNQVVLLTTDHKLYRWNGEEWTAAVPTTDLVGKIVAEQIGEGAVGTAAFATTLRPIEVLSVLPATGKEGQVVFLTADGKLYRWTAAGWTAAVPVDDLEGKITETHIDENSITTPLIRAGHVTSAKLYSGEVMANRIQAGNIAVGAIRADQIASGAVRTEKLFVGSLANPVNNFSITGHLEGWTEGGVLATDVLRDGAPVRTLNVTTTGSVQILSAPFEVDPSQTLEVRLSVHSAHPDDRGTRYFGLFAYDQNGTQLQVTPFSVETREFLAPTDNPYFWAGEVHSGQWRDMTGYILGTAVRPEEVPQGKNVGLHFRLPPTATHVRIRFLNYENGGVAVRNDFFSPSVTSTQGTLIHGSGIVTGSITANQLRADSVTADHIVANGVLAKLLTVDKITAGAIETGAIRTEAIESGAVTATKISIAELSDLKRPGPGGEPVGLGIMVSGKLLGKVDAQNRQPFMDLNATGSSAFLYHPAFRINADGSAVFSGDLNAAGGTFSGNLSGAGGTFSGDLSAAGGTFSGDLSAAGGTFSGHLEAASGTFKGSVALTSDTGNKIEFQDEGQPFGFIAATGNTSSEGVTGSIRMNVASKAQIFLSTDTFNRPGILGMARGTRLQWALSAVDGIGSDQWDMWRALHQTWPTRDDRLVMGYAQVARFQFRNDGWFFADAGSATFSPKPPKAAEEMAPADWLEWGAEDARKPVKPYVGIPSEDHPEVVEMARVKKKARADVAQAEHDKYAKDISKIAIGTARWADEVWKALARARDFEDFKRRLGV